MRPRRFFAVLVCLALSARAFAASYTLFMPTTERDLFWESSPAPTYDNIVASLKPGDRVTFSNGQTFEIESSLGHGKTSRVFGIKGQSSRALRIPSTVQWYERTNVPSESKHRYVHSREFIDSTIIGYEALQKHGVRTVRLYDRLPGEFVLVDRLPANAIPLTRLFEADISPQEFKLLSDRLVDFATQTSDFAYIGDFNVEQIKYDPHLNEWVLIDWTETHFYHPHPEKHVFNEIIRGMRKHKSALFRDLALRIDAGILHVRAQRAKARFHSSLNCFGMVFRKP